MNLRPFGNVLDAEEMPMEMSPPKRLLSEVPEGPLTQREVAQRLGLTLDQVRQAEKTGLRKLKKALMRLGWTPRAISALLEGTYARATNTADRLIRLIFEHRPLEDKELEPDEPS